MTETNTHSPQQEQIHQEHPENTPNFAVGALVKFRESRLQSKHEKLEANLGRMALNPDSRTIEPIRPIYYPAEDHQTRMTPGTERLPEEKREARDPRTGKWTFLGENGPIANGSTYRREYRVSDETRRMPVSAKETVSERLNSHRLSKAQTIRANKQYRLKQVYGNDIGSKDFVQRIKSERWPSSMRRRALKAHRAFIKSEKKAAKLDNKVVEKVKQVEKKYESKINKKASKVEKATEKINKIRDKYPGLFNENESDNIPQRSSTNGHAIKTMAKTAKDDAKAIGKYAGRHAKNFYDRKKTEASTGYQDGSAGNPNDGRVFPVIDDRIIKPLAHKAGQKIGEHQARKQGEATPKTVHELNPSADKTVVLVGGITEGIKTLGDLGQALADQDLHVVSFDYTNQTAENSGNAEYHPASHTAKTEQLEKILDDLEGREDITLFAHSQGASIAVAAALEDPSKIKHLVLANPSGLFEDSFAGLVKRFGTETIRKTLTMKKPAIKQQVYGGKEMLMHPKNFLGDAVDIAHSDMRGAIQQLRSQGIKVDVLLGAKDQVFPWKKVGEGINPTNDSAPDDIVVDSVSSYFTTKVGRGGKTKQHKFASKWAGHDQPVIYPKQTAKLVRELIDSK